MESDVALLAADLSSRSEAMAAGSRLAAPDNAHPLRDSVVRRMLKTGSELMTSCAALARGPHEQAVNILVRSILEMGMKTHWATMSEDNAGYLAALGKEQLKTIFNANASRGIARIVDAEGRDVTQELTDSGRFKKAQDKISIETMASQSGLADIYNVFYRFLSMHSHANDVAASSSETDPITLNGVGAFSTLLGHVAAERQRLGSQKQ
jgi:hypothetical protein